MINLEMLVVNVSIYSEETLEDGLSNVEKVVRKRNSYLAGKKCLIIQLVLEKLFNNRQVINN